MTDLLSSGMGGLIPTVMSGNSQAAGDAPESRSNAQGVKPRTRKQQQQSRKRVTTAMNYGL